MRVRGETIVLAPALLGPVPEPLADAAARESDPAHLRAFLSQAKHLPGAEALNGEEMLLSELARLLDRPLQQLPRPGALAAAFIGINTERIHYRAAPVHLRPDRDRVVVFAGEGLRLSPGEADQITHDFNNLFGSDDIALQTAGNEWVLSVGEPPGPDLLPLTAVAGRYLDRVMPTDTPSRAWRQLLNEIQMFLHDHPVNRARAAAGALSVNGFWFWGGGRLESLAIDRPLVLIADDPASRGLARLAQLPLQPLESPPPSSAEGDRIIVWLEAEKALGSGDAEAWLQALQRFDAQWGPWLLAAQRDGRTAIRLDTGYGRFVGAKAAWRRWWRHKQGINPWIQRA